MKAQHEPQEPWFLTDVTMPLEVQLREIGFPTLKGRVKGLADSLALLSLSGNNPSISKWGGRNTFLFGLSLICPVVDTGGVVGD